MALPSSSQITPHGTCLLSLSSGAVTTELLKEQRSFLSNLNSNLWKPTNKVKQEQQQEVKKTEQLLEDIPCWVFVQKNQIQRIQQWFGYEEERPCMNHLLKAHITVRWIQPKPPNIHQSAC